MKATVIFTQHFLLTTEYYLIHSSLWHELYNPRQLISTIAVQQGSKKMMKKARTKFARYNRKVSF